MDKLIDPTLWAAQGGLLGLIIFGVFIVLGFVLLGLQKKIDSIPLQIGEAKAEIILQQEKIKSCVLKALYDSGAIPDRRKRNKLVENDQREN